MLYVAWKRGLFEKFARFVLFRPIKKRCFYLLCILDLFSHLIAGYRFISYAWIGKSLFVFSSVLSQDCVYGSSSSSSIP